MHAALGDFGTVHVLVVGDDESLLCGAQRFGVVLHRKTICGEPQIQGDPGASDAFGPDKKGECALG